MIRGEISGHRGGSQKAGSQKRGNLAFYGFVAALGALIVANAAPRLGRWSGDALIHLTMAERFAEGRPFQFNAGEVASGSSSPGWTLLGGALFRLGGARVVAYAMPAIAAAALLGAAALAYRIAQRLGASQRAAALGALSFLAIPGVLYNAVFPMEASAFALAALAFALSLESDLPPRAAVPISGALLAAALLLRPEGVVLGALPLVDARSRRRALPIFAVAFLLVLPVIYLHHAVTGLWVSGSAVSRLMAARRSPLAFHIAGPSWVYGDIVARFLAFFPLVALGLLGARGSGPLGRRLLVMIAGGFGLYAFVTGAFHAARLTIWIFAALAALAPVAGERLARGSSRARALGIAAGALFLMACAGETIARFRISHQAHGGVTAAEVIAQYASRRATTDTMLASLCAGACCRPDAPPAIALTEVQTRWGLDDRISVVSLDGRTRALRGPAIAFAPDGCIDADAVLRDPAVVGVLEPPAAGPRCSLGATGSALARAWGGAGPPAPGFQWDSKLGGLVRSCKAP